MRYVSIYLIDFDDILLLFLSALFLFPSVYFNFTAGVLMEFFQQSATSETVKKIFKRKMSCLYSLEEKFIVSTFKKTVVGNQKIG